MSHKKHNRSKKLKRLRLGFEKFKSDVRKKHPEANFSNYPLYKYLQKSRLKPKPEYSDTTKFFNSKTFAFNDTTDNFDSNTFIIPEVFSIHENYFQTTLFIKKLFNSLYSQVFNEIFIDYGNCKQIDVCASMCMDIILADFITYQEQCKRDRHPIKIKRIKPINFDNYDVKKILFSVGAYRNLTGIEISFPNLIPFPIIIGNKDNPQLPEEREADITKMVDYVSECLAKLNKKLTDEAETNLLKAIGEIVINAEEHSTTKKRYIIGYFEQSSNDSNGIFNMAILNFGDTIYETFKNSDTVNRNIVKQMEELSEKYTSNGWFRRKKFEEETLWTLYALQDGVTRMNEWQRGNGAIRFIESFFNLKGKAEDNISKMVITSGHTRIVFDGVYKITEKQRGKDTFKMMTFNDSGNIEDLPDKKYVMYEENYFPGTIISVKLKLDYEITKNIK